MPGVLPLPPPPAPPLALPPDVPPAEAGEYVGVLVKRVLQKPRSRIFGPLAPRAQGGGPRR